MDQTVQTLLQTALQIAHQSQVAHLQLHHVEEDLQVQVQEVDLHLDHLLEVDKK